MYSDINVADVQNAEFSQYLKDEKIEVTFYSLLLGKAIFYYFDWELLFFVTL